MAENENVKQNVQAPAKIADKPTPVVAEKSAEEVELAQLTLKEKRLAVAFQQAQLEDMQERLDERSLKREVSRSRSITNGATLRQLAENDEKNQTRCNHHKGGNGLNGYVGGQGDDPQFAVIKHKMSNSDLWIRCMRCGKTWKPPVESDYKTSEEFAAAQTAYQVAVNFPTRNVTSSSVVFQFSDGGKFFREQTKAATLR